MIIKILISIILIASTGFTDVQFTDPLFRDGAEADYLIVAPGDSGIMVQAKRLSNLKWEKGLKTRIVRMDSIIDNVPGSDTREKTRNIIKEAYENWSITWVLLLGDHALIPPGKMWAYSNDTINPETMDSDIYYACLDSTWDRDGDGMLGEEQAIFDIERYCYYDSLAIYHCDYIRHIDSSGLDLWPDVYIGRLPASNGAEARIMINKIIQYGYTPQNSEYTEKILMLAEECLLQVPSPLDSGFIDDGTYYLHREIKPILEKDSSRFARFGFDEVYEDTILPDGRVVNDSIQRDAQVYIDFLSKGHNLVYYNGHGSPNAWQTCSFTNPQLYLNAPEVLNIQSSTLVNIIAASCETMIFDQGISIAKNFLLAENGGAVSYSGNSSDIWGRIFDMYGPMADALACRNINRLSRAFVLSVLENFSRIEWYASQDRHYYFCHQFWGDPELEIWTRNVTDKDTFTINAYKDVGGQCIISLAPALDSIFVCMYKKDIVFERGYTQNGEVAFDGINEGLKGVKVTATKHNYLPTSILLDMDKLGTEDLNRGSLSGSLVNIMPNPFSNQFTVRIKRGKYESPISLKLYDIQGRLIKIKVIEKGKTEPEVVLRTSGMAKGLYFLKVQMGSLKILKKIIYQ